jgi:hypothetical protein
MDQDEIDEIHVKEWVNIGEFPAVEKPKDGDEILEQAQELLDSCESEKILGPNLFLATDGHWYQVQVQAVIVRLSDEEATLLKSPAWCEYGQTNDLCKLATSILYRKEDGTEMKVCSDCLDKAYASGQFSLFKGC